MVPPTVSVIIPARNAASTLPDTMASLLSQTSAHWEAFIVDDGSTDATRSMAQEYASHDRRIHVLTASGVGVSTARNVGIAAARGEWLLFLDADDWVLPGFVERLTGEAGRNPDAAVVYCGWTRVNLQGQSVTYDLWEQTADMFPTLARLCPFAIHSCVSRASTVQLIGGFDTSLVACEDWDLWQRIARRGGRFVQVPEYLACYRMREDSASIDAGQMLADGLRVIDLGHRADPRLEPSGLVWPNGISPVGLARTRLGFCCWAAGLAISKGEDAVALLTLVGADRATDVDPSTVAGALFRSMPLYSCRGPEAWADLWPDCRDAVERFVEALERRSGTPRLRSRTIAALERLILEHSLTLPRSAGRQYGAAVDASGIVAALSVPTGAERALIVVAYGEERLGSVELPVCDGQVTAAVLADAIAAKYMWPMLARVLAPIYASLRIARTGDRVAVYRDRICLAADLVEENLSPGRLHDVVGWTIFLQELFDRPDMNGAQFYDESWVDRRRAPVRRVRDGDWIRVEATADVPALQGPAGEIFIELTVGGSAIVVLPVTIPRQGLRAHALRARLIAAGGLELARVAVREGVLRARAAPRDGWRAQLAERAADVPSRPDVVQLRRSDLSPASDDALARALADRPVSLVIGRRAGLAVGSSASRHAAFPAAVAADVREAALAAGEPVVDLQSGSTIGAVAYVPEIFSWPLGPIFSPARGHTISSIVTERVPILRYHRIAEAAADATAPARVAPRDFEAQLRYLRDAGFRSISLEEWRRAVDRRRPVDGRAIVLTFDDGCQDFADEAWPLLRTYGFGAIVFLVSTLAGGVNTWDSDFGARVPLMDWSTVAGLEEEGVEFGAHSATHPAMTTLSPDEVVREVCRCRTTLLSRLQRPLPAFAYPYGDIDEVVQHLVGACGYQFGVTCEPRRCRPEDSLLALPRLEVRGGATLDDFIATLAAG